MKKILLLIPQNVIPATDGGKLGIYKPMQLLARKYEVKVIVFCDKSEEVFNSQQYLAIGVEPILASVDKKDKLTAILANIFTRLPFKFSKYYKRKYKHYIEELCRQWSPDVLICHHSHLAVYCQNLKTKFPAVKLILREHNVEYLLVKQYFKLQKNPLLKLFAFWQYKKTEKYERQCWDYFTSIAFISDSDFKCFTPSTAKAKGLVIYDGMGNAFEKQVTKSKENSFLFTGSLNSYQNKINLANFVNTIWRPWKLNAIYGSENYELWITGDKNDNIVLSALALTPAEANKLNIKILGYVNNLPCLIASSRFFLSPTIIGAGIRVKVLEAMGVGAVVFLTPADIEMSKLLKNNYNVLVYDDLYLFNKQFASVKDNIASYNHISKQAEITATTNFTWSLFLEKLELLFGAND